MYLFIDPSQHGQLRLYLVNKECTYSHLADVKNRELLQEIDMFLNKHHLGLPDLTGITVRLGVGGFTSTRIAVTVANTLAYAQQIKVVGVHKPFDDVVSLDDTFKDVEIGSYVHALYSGEPNINT